MKYIKNKNIQITFTIKEELYFRFKTLCKGEKKNSATTTLSPVEIGRMVVRGMNEQIQRLFQEENLLELIRTET